MANGKVYKLMKEFEKKSNNKIGVAYYKVEISDEDITVEADNTLTDEMAAYIMADMIYNADKHNGVIAAAELMAASIKIYQLRIEADERNNEKDN